METQATLAGDEIRVEKPQTKDAFRSCCATVTNGDPSQARTCRYDPFLIAVCGSERRPYCKTHAREEWIKAYGSSQ